MKSNYSKSIRFIYFFGDLLIINSAFFITYFYKFESFERFLTDNHYQTLLLVFNLSWVVATSVLKPYNIYRVTRYENVVSSLFRLFVFHILLVMGFWVMQKAYYYSREHLLTTFALLFMMITVWRLAVIYMLKRYRKRGYNYRRVIIAGCGENAEELNDFFVFAPEHGYKLLGLFDDNNRDLENCKGDISSIKAFALKHEVDEIFCSIPDLKPEQITDLIEFADNNLIRIKMVPDVRGFINKQLSVDFYGHLPVLLFRDIPLDDITNRVLKRAFDFVFSAGVILFILSWLYPIIAISIKMSSKGPVLFKQNRSGKDNEEFVCWKFRTMHVNEDADKTQAIKGDSRIFKLGAFLRKTSMDELPQFFNVLGGRMSIVGPRPHMVKHTEEYAQSIDKYMVRHFVKPGITGLAQVKGFRGETTDPQMMRNRIHMDKLYIESWSFLLDIRIIVQTVLNVSRRDDNAY